MICCVGVKLEGGLAFASDSRTHAGLDNDAKFCKMTLFERAGDRVLVLPSSSGLAATQAVINVPRTRASAQPPHIWTAASMFDVANLVADAMRDIERRDGPFLEGGGLKFNASFILGGQIAGEDMLLFRICAEGNFIEAGTDTSFLQTGQAKYGKPILDLAVTPNATLEDTTKCVLVSFDSTMLGNLSVGMPIDLLCHARDSLKVMMKRRFDTGDICFESLKQRWFAGTRKVFHDLPPLECWASRGCIRWRIRHSGHARLDPCAAPMHRKARRRATRPDRNALRPRPRHPAPQRRRTDKRRFAAARLRSCTRAVPRPMAFRRMSTCACFRAC